MSCKVKIHVTPNAKKFAVKGFDQWRGAWLVDISARAEKGKANKELVSELSRLFGKEVRLVAGVHSRDKVVEIQGLDENTVNEILAN